jgi:hypothetical protein
MDLHLCYGSVVLGEVLEVFCHQGTWFGTFVSAEPDEGAAGRQAREFIAFSRDWNRRSYDDLEHDVSEFDAFADVIGPGFWQIRANDDTVIPILDAPNFFGEDGMSWLALEKG